MHHPFPFDKTVVYSLYGCDSIFKFKRFYISTVQLYILLLCHLHFLCWGGKILFLNLSKFIFSSKIKRVLLYIILSIFFHIQLTKEFVMFLMYLKPMLVIRIVSQFFAISFIDAVKAFLGNVVEGSLFYCFFFNKTIMIDNHGAKVHTSSLL